MKRGILVLAVVLITVSVAIPAFADVEFLYGGQFRVRYNASENNMDGTSLGGYYGNYAPQMPDALGKPNSYYNSNDNRNYIDQRLRLYFSFIGSKNLKVVTKFEIGDTTWGDPGVASSLLGQRTGQNGGGNIGADQVAIEVKNAYMEFNIPNTPSTALLGIQTITLLDSWIVDDDFSAGVLISKFDPFRVTLGYIGGQYGAERRFGTGSPPMGTSGLSNTYLSYTNQDANLDDFFLAVDYTCAPFKASLVAFYQDGHKTNTSIDPSTLQTPVSAYAGFTDTGFMPVQNNIKSNDLFDLGFNLTYKTDIILAYVNFVQNLGEVDYNLPVQMTTLDQTSGAAGKGRISGTTLAALPTVSSSEYEGYMIDAGATYFRPPFTFNVGGFLTSGPHFSENVGSNGSGLLGSTQSVSSSNILPTTGGLPFRGTDDTNVTWFTFPLATAKYSSEIIGGGVLGDDVYIERGFLQGFSASKFESGTPGAGALGTVYWRGYSFPTNLWTLTTGSSYQLGPNTKLSASYWYWGTPDAVPVAYDRAGSKAVAAATTESISSTTAVSNFTKEVVTSTTTYTMTPAYDTATTYDMSSSIGHEFNFYLDQRIVDNLTLTFVAAFLLADDAFCPLPFGNTFGPGSTTTKTITQSTTITSAGAKTVGAATTTTSLNSLPTNTNAANYFEPAATNSWKLGARLQWNF